MQTEVERYTSSHHMGLKALFTQNKGELKTTELRKRKFSSEYLSADVDFLVCRSWFDVVLVFCFALCPLSKKQELKIRGSDSAYKVKEIEERF